MLELMAILGQDFFVKAVLVEFAADRLANQSAQHESPMRPRMCEARCGTVTHGRIRKRVL